MSSNRRGPTYNFGEQVPFAEPAWYRDWESPYYNESHKKFRQKVRDFIEKEIRPFSNEWEEDHISKGTELPLEIFRKAYDAGIYAPGMPIEWGGTPPEGGWDAFHDLIWLDELARGGSGGVCAGFTIYTMGLPPVLNFGSKYLKDKVLRDVITAKKFISLCISEPYAGSDVAALRTTAKRDGDFYIVNGEKKWITWAIHADYFTVACRTGDEGNGGISLLLIERNMPGVEVKRMKLQGNWLAGTCMVTFHDVKVPVKNLIGKENEGFKMIMHNFNHERFVISVQTCRTARMCIEEAINYGRNRTTFGIRLVDHQALRHKIADMAMRVEALQALLELIAYQMKVGIPQDKLGGVMAIAKVNASKTFEICAREASQILGGASYVRGGKGQLVERLYREVRGTAIPGGSEEIMLELAMRQAKL